MNQDEYFPSDGMQKSGSSFLKKLTVYLFLIVSGALHWNVVAAEEKAPSGLVEEPLRVDVCVLCHQSQYDAIKVSPHWMSGDERTPGAVHECASCHGNLQEHVMSAGNSSEGGMTTYKKTTKLLPEEQNAVCMSCHKGTDLIHWAGSAHDNGDVGCVGCHRIHMQDKVRSKSTETEVCYTCHTDMRGQENKPFTHPLREGKMVCSDCHNSHGGIGDRELKTFTINENCYTCHAEKRGPVLWEHIPVSENCLLCHNVHGSIHKGMLTQREPHLCQTCHEPVGAGSNPGGPHQQHARIALSYRDPALPDVGPNNLGNKGISRFVMGQACSNCHSRVHGSNHPAGEKFTR